MPRNTFLNDLARERRANPGYPPKPCLHCGKEFVPYHLNRQRFCSVICKKRAYYKTENPRVEKTCVQCGTSFTPKASNKAIHCSPKCRSDATLARLKVSEERRQRRRERDRIYSKSAIYRFNQMNNKAKRRAAERVGRVSQEEWTAILEKYGYACAYCRAAEVKLTVDHVAPLSKGGKHEASNVVPACKTCNSTKNAQDWSHKLKCP